MHGIFYLAPCKSPGYDVFPLQDYQICLDELKTINRETTNSQKSGKTESLKTTRRKDRIPLKSDFKGDRTKLTKQKKLECCPYLQPILYANTRFSPLSQSGSTFYCRSSTTREGCGSPAPLCRPAASNYFFS